MRVGIHPVSLKWEGGAAAIGPKLAESARVAEEGGCSSYLLMDHYFFLEQMGPIDDPMIEGYTTLGYLAGRTQSIQLGLLVTGVTYRHPGLLAKIVTTLDILSHGRAILGIGAAWHEREHLGLGVPFPPLSERFERLEEALRICHQMWSENNGPFHGKHYRLAETLCSPQPITRPHPPILIGGGGEKKTLRLVARYADACNLFASDVGQIAHKLDVLKAHCDSEGRSYTEIEKTVMFIGNPFDDLPAFLDAMERYTELSVSTVFLVPRGDPVDFCRRVGEDIVPPLTAMSG